MEQAAEFEDAANEKQRQSAAGRALRQQVITRIAQRDPALAHQLLRAYVPAPGEATADGAFGQLYGRDTPRSDVLLNAASELLSTDAGVATQILLLVHEVSPRRLRHAVCLAAILLGCAAHRRT
jgi:hypothetical protein